MKVWNTLPEIEWFGWQHLISCVGLGLLCAQRHTFHDNRNQLGDQIYEIFGDFPGLSDP